MRGLPIFISRPVITLYGHAPEYAYYSPGEVAVWKLLFTQGTSLLLRQRSKSICITHFQSAMLKCSHHQTVPLWPTCSSPCSLSAGAVSWPSRNYKSAVTLSSDLLGYPICQSIGKGMIGSLSQVQPREGWLTCAPTATTENFSKPPSP